MRTCLLLASIVWTSCGIASAEHEDLTRLRQDWKETRARALDPIDKKYVAALETLKTRLTKAGDLAAAKEVDAELTMLLASPIAGFKGKLTPELLVRGEWRFDNKPARYTSHFTFNSAGEIFERGQKGVMGRWTIKGGRLRMDFKRTWDEFALDYDGGVILTEKNSSNGERPKVTLTYIADD